MLFLYNDIIQFRPQKYPTQAASGREMDVTMGLCLICYRGHLSVALFIWSIEPLATLWRHLGGGWRTQISGNIKQHLNLSLVSVD